MAEPLRFLNPNRKAFASISSHPQPDAAFDRQMFDWIERVLMRIRSVRGFILITAVIYQCNIKVPPNSVPEA